ncbi:dihydroxyacetone kinase subunit L [Longibacter salinarum]|uniref:Dihydroxyacetone kinase subunit L n=1 Tax=Longibacter salinarum TaxID=1850348 RepID=A0A2A8D306_9BACT|nr:dihydroxyacetone kinase subunit DhaL [Longibacter salinarum]PEN15028.1 dihydroxyacetone kinase subunit L [Longibacter salinarum]
MSRDSTFVRSWIEAFFDRVEENQKYLTKLDSAIGDGDHGQNMVRGLRAAVQSLNDSDTRETLRNVAMSIISKTGGASGPLYGTLFMEAGKTAPDGPIALSDWAAMMRAGLDGVQRRGKAETGEKTMVDALTPAVEALESAVEQDASWSDALSDAAAAAKDGMESTTPMIATKGRASYLGDRSAGHQDPGATSSFYLFAAAVDANETSAE